MPTTSFGFSYPAGTDSVDVPRDLEDLARDSDGRVHRAFPCTDTTKPADLTAADRGFLIDNGTTGQLERWTGTGWAIVGAAAGGGGGGGEIGRGHV